MRSALENTHKPKLCEQANIINELCLEFGPFVVSRERAEELKRMLALADKDIEDHDSEVACLQKQLMLVQAKKQRLESQRDQLRSLLSPMRKLSNELLLHIFHLWANVKVEIQAVSSDQVKALAGFTDTVAQYLEKSGDWPLQITLSISGTRATMYLPGILERGIEFPSLIYLTQHAHRWRTFKLRCHSSLRYPAMLSGLHFSSLTELNLSPFEHYDLDCFEPAPRLCALAHNKISPSKAPYHQLRHLNLQYGCSKLVKVLQRCPSVESLELLGWENDPKYGACYTWPNITSLVIKAGDVFYPKSYMEIVLLTFALPSLREIVLESHRTEPYPWSTETFISFISRSSCMISTFTLCSVSISDSDHIAVLRVMPSLLHLKINDYTSSNPQSHHGPITLHLISSLIQHESTSISLVPKLHTLHLDCHHNTGTFDDSAFVSMVKSRWARPGSDLSATMSAMGRDCIRSVVLKFDWREVDAEVYKPLRALDKEGLRVVVAGTNGIQV
ncbi:hypothetical protein BDP27DRAFT_1425311 [Rhodocollybia butyracea]|uniref:F-box domain-containing protein n=1 Tax=Rhodocollybia butyracea TaxID=206335 RepID=A0A9P5PKH8_9AGAR|nr:hypothetical protein BDP27DRAFT_1425311 [Rhodocollybia butyracea]